MESVVKLELVSTEVFEEYLDRYLELTAQLKKLEAERKEIQNVFENYFTNEGITEYRFYDTLLRKQERKTITYPDTGEFKGYLDSKGLWHLAVSPDKTKIDRLVKAKLLNPEELVAFQQVKTTYAWMLEKVKEAE